MLEFRQALRSGESVKRLRVVPINPMRFAFKTHEEALNYYRRGADQFFLVFGNDVFTYDRHPVVAGLGAVSGTLAQSVAIALGIYPKLVIVPSGTNRQMTEALHQRRNRFFGAAILILILSLALAIEVVIYRRAANSSPHAY